ncbi:3'(2'),5'-bisphosphate nucleotidase CysQ [Vibrio sp. SS-MA-C1-2]|uniref:3'(2'),5'-bisphosphate nucleotidase CysQ n=1 Tax=Vibrio sp. SS-MA-C1-2 TaxID=2908646 RepID=UPI001F29337E|nr:3'(2'),5'-bisphosphate nucleotidase CysQ [Vibrio sp. SS-MA-C1-2]UJF19453.1 3'(2'),5'-bisphosphate nucleotidase CysQ [Vibrio sp. SS-MA-C1-2]
MDLGKLLPDVINIAKAAGDLIADIYQKDQYQHQIKQDQTPVTSADIAAHQLMLEQLQQLTPDIPILSEEDTSISFSERAQWHRYWLVDPLDGTQEFIAKSGDFASVVALVEDNKPVMGVVYAPMLDLVYYGANDVGVWKKQGNNDPETISIAKDHDDPKAIRLGISRRQNVNILLNKLSTEYQYRCTPLGSAALKACYVAEGAVDAYIRLGPTGEWDTAATQCILELAGGTLRSTELEPLSYNRRESLENPNFIAMGDGGINWSRVLRLNE